MYRNKFEESRQKGAIEYAKLLERIDEHVAGFRVDVDLSRLVQAYDNRRTLPQKGALPKVKYDKVGPTAWMEQRSGAYGLFLQLSLLDAMRTVSLIPSIESSPGHRMSHLPEGIGILIDADGQETRYRFEKGLVACPTARINLYELPTRFSVRLCKDSDK